MMSEAEQIQTEPTQKPTPAKKKASGPPKRNRSPEKRNRDRNIAAASEARETVKAKPKSNPYQLKDAWALIRLNAPQDNKEEKEVLLGHNGLLIRVQKGKWVPVNWVFVDKLEHASIPVYSNEPGQQREPMGFRSRFNYQGPFKITEQQYKELSAIAKVRDITPAEVEAAVGHPVH